MLDLSFQTNRALGHWIYTVTGIYIDHKDSVEQGPLHTTYSREWDRGGQSKMQYSEEKLKLKQENSQIWMFSPNKLGSAGESLIQEIE